MALKLLVVDDEPDLEILIRQRFRKKIRDREFEFLFARNGVEALETLDQRQDIEIVLTDINMPKMDGLTLLSRLKERGGILKSVVISAYGDIENIRTAMNRGAFDFLTKPIDFEDLDITIEKTRAEIEAIRKAQDTHRTLAALEHELNVASQIQQSMLPQVFPAFPERSDFDIYARMVPAKAIGGDFYDFFLVDDHHLAVVIGDVSGKGVPAALFMALTRMLVKTTAITGLSPHECLARVNRVLHEEKKSYLFVTLFYGLLDLRSGQLEYCNAGHNPPLHLGGAKGLHPLDPIGGTVLGVRDDGQYESGGHSLKPGEGLFLYTDGVTEAMNPSRSLYTDERLHATLLSAAPSASGIVDQVMDDINAFAQGAQQHDDITALALRYRGAP